MASHPRKTKPKRQTFHPTEPQHRNEAVTVAAASRLPTQQVSLKAQNAAQRFYIKTLIHGEEPFVVAHGPAGTGKTYIAVLDTANKLISGEIKKVVITRPMVGAGEDLGFLPGDVTNKVLPWCIPIIDAFEEALGVAQTAKLIENKTIEIAPLALMRGRTLKNAVIIADETQNTTPEQMKMLLTRIGHGSRMIITGDIEQHDRGYAKSGLLELLERLDRHGSRAFAVHRFDKGDCVRHPAIEDVLEMFA